MLNTKNISFFSKWRHQLREVWQSHLSPWWREYRWPVTGLLWIGTWALGYIGFSRESAKLPDEEWTFLGTLYSAAQLFTLESGSNMGSGTLNWQLEAARWLAPFVAAFTAAEALASIFYEHLQRLRLLNIGDHVVICGLGDKGLLLTKGFRKLGYEVVVIEQDEDNDLIPSCRELGASVLIGNGTTQEMLSKARVQNARLLIAVCDEDGINAEIAAHARDLVKDRSGQALHCTTHIVDPALWHLLRRWEINTIDNFRLQFFNVFDAGARALLHAHSPFTKNTHQETGQPVEKNAQTPFTHYRPRLLVVGVGRLGQSLVAQASLQWRSLHTTAGEIGPDERLRVTLIDKDTEHIREWLCLRHPELEKVCEVTAHSMDINSPAFHRGEFLFNERGECDVTVAYICVNDEIAALSAALALYHRSSSHSMPIVVRMTESKGLATLLSTVDDYAGVFESVHAFGLLERTCQPDVVIGGTLEMLARAIHEAYVRDQEALGQTVDTSPAMVPWENLSEESKESNRREADHLGLKLQNVDCEVGPLMEWNAALFTFTAPEINLMAQLEHERWLAERQRSGWTYGIRDPKKKTNPNLLLWEDLPEEIKQLNYEMVHEIPSFLASAGFQIYRLRSL